MCCLLGLHHLLYKCQRSKARPDYYIVKLTTLAQLGPCVWRSKIPLFKDLSGCWRLSARVQVLKFMEIIICIQSESTVQHCKAIANSDAFY